MGLSQHFYIHFIEMDHGLIRIFSFRLLLIQLVVVDAPRVVAAPAGVLRAYTRRRHRACTRTCSQTAAGLLSEFLSHPLALIPDGSMIAAVVALLGPRDPIDAG